MNILNIKKLIKLFERSEMSELSYADDEFKLTLKQAETSQQPTQIHAIQTKSTDKSNVKKEPEEMPSNLKIVKSPMVGIFYRASSPKAKPFVEIGKTINKGDTLCIIEAMKIMNEIESEFSGVIRKINIKNAERVEYGTALFFIEPL